MTDTVTSAASVSITGLHKSYGKNEVLRGIDIQDARRTLANERAPR